MGMTERQADRPPPEHAGHDRLLIARAVADDALSPAERTAVAGLLMSCPACAALDGELRAITASLAADLPTPRRPRDFRISPDLMARGPSWRERLRGGFSVPVARPLAGAVCALGLLLAVTGAVLPRAGTPTTLSNVGSAVTGAGAPAAEPAADGGAATPASTAGEDRNTKSGGSPVPTAVGILVGPPEPRSPTPPTALGSIPGGGAGDYTAGGVPPAAGRSPTPGGPDPDTLLIGAGVVLFAAGGGAYVVLRRRLI
jgi:hypothetical protein